MAEAPTGRSATPPYDQQQFALFLDLIGEINRGASPQHVFGLVADTLRHIFGIDRFALVLVQPDGSLGVTEKRGLSDRYMAAVARRQDETAGARSLEERRPIYIPDAPDDPEFWPLQDAAREEGFRTVLILPLFSGTEPLGYLIMYHDAPRAYTPAEVALAQALAQQAGLAIQQARLFAATEAHRADLERRFQQRVAEAEVIDAIVLRISSSLDVESTLQSITEAAASLSGADSASLYLRDEDGLYRAKAAHGVPLERLQSVVLSPADGLLRQMIETGLPATTADFEHDVRSTAEAYDEVRRLQIHATLGVPLLEGDTCVGALYVGQQRAEPFSTETIRILQRLAAFARVALQNARRFSSIEATALERERSRSQLLAELLELSVFLNSDLSILTLMERVVEAAMALVGARSGTLGLIEGDALMFRRFHTPDGWVDFDMALRRGEGAPGHVWETEQPYVCNDCPSDPYVLQDVREQLGFRQLAYVPIIDREGSLIGTLGVYDPIVPRDFSWQDIEALQLLAHQGSIAIENARLNEMRDAFLSIVSHELKTPVTSIKGFTQMLQRKLSRESLESGGRYLEVINQQADRLTTLINDLLDLSRIQMGRFHFDTVPLDYTQLVRDVIAEMQLITPDNPIRLEAPGSAAVHGNANRLRQVLVNLIDNGATHGPVRGTITVTVSIDADVVTTCVGDEGPGLPPGEEERVFNPYYQVQQSGQVGGLGLGLHISKQIVEEHRGRIWADSGNHTRFCFSVPREG